MEIHHYSELPEYDASSLSFQDGSYYLRYNDPKEFVDIPDYQGPWQNVDGLERDRRIHVINTPSINGFVLDYGTEGFEEARNIFQNFDEEMITFLFGQTHALPSTDVDIVPGDIILRDQRWMGTITGSIGDTVVSVSTIFNMSNTGLVTKVHAEYIETDFSEIPAIGKKLYIDDVEYLITNIDAAKLVLEGGTTGIEVGMEIFPEATDLADKRLSPVTTVAVDTGYVLAVESTHLVVDLFEASNYVVINDLIFTVTQYTNGKLFLAEDFSSITVGMEVVAYEEAKRLPLFDSDWEAWASGSELRTASGAYWIIDHYPNARSVVTGKNGLPMYLTSEQVYQHRSEHPDYDPDNIISRLLPEVWSWNDNATITQLRLKTPLLEDYDNEPFMIVNKQWYVATVEVLSTLPSGHEPKCWQYIRLGGQDLPYRLRRFCFDSWGAAALDGDIFYSFGEQIDPPLIEDWWVEDTIPGELVPRLINPYPNWYQKLGDDVATFTRILTVSDLTFYAKLGEFKDMFLLNLQDEPYQLGLPSVGSEGLEWHPWAKSLFSGGIYYV